MPEGTGDRRAEIEQVLPGWRALEQAFDECLSVGAVARRMNELGLLPVSRKSPHRGEPMAWNTDRLWKLLRRPVYTGDWEFGYTCDKSNTVREGYRDRLMRQGISSLRTGLGPRSVAGSTSSRPTARAATRACASASTCTRCWACSLASRAGPR